MASPGGLVTALRPIAEARHGTWVGWGGATGADAGAIRPRRDPPAPGLAQRRARSSAYYEGQSNATIWPLYHDAVETPVYNRAWRDAYRTVNAAVRGCRRPSVAARGATVWVHDYQLQLVPAMLRAPRPDLRIGFFLHIPFPPIELFMQMPLRAEILRGLLGADLVGFQQKLAAQNFVRLARHLLGLRYRGTTIDVDGRTVTAGAYPDLDRHEGDGAARRDRGVQARARQIRTELGDPKTLILGVDRLDYTKGIELRLEAFRELLEDGTLTRPGNDAGAGRDAEPGTRRALRAAADEGRARGGPDQRRLRPGRLPAVHYLHQSYNREELTALYCAADVMMVTPLRDGMNLVAKEYVALADRPGRRARAERVRRGGDRAAPRLPVQPARPRRRQGRACARSRRRPTRTDAAGCRSCSGICATTTWIAGPARSSPT